MRCVRFFVRGVLSLQPVPYHSDYRCYEKGQFVTFSAVGACIPFGLIALGWMLGRYL